MLNLACTFLGEDLFLIDNLLEFLSFGLRSCLLFIIVVLEYLFWLGLVNFRAYLFLLVISFDNLLVFFLFLLVDIILIHFSVLLIIQIVLKSAEVINHFDFINELFHYLIGQLNLIDYFVVILKFLNFLFLIAIFQVILISILFINWNHQIAIINSNYHFIKFHFILEAFIFINLFNFH